MGSKTMQVKGAESQSFPAPAHTAPQCGSGVFFAGVSFCPLGSASGSHCMSFWNQACRIRRPADNPSFNDLQCNGWRSCFWVKRKTVIRRQPPFIISYKISVFIFLFSLKFIKLPSTLLLKPFISVSLFVALSVILIPTFVILSLAVNS